MVSQGEILPIRLLLTPVHVVQHLTLYLLRFIGTLCLFFSSQLWTYLLWATPSLVCVRHQILLRISVNTGAKFLPKGTFWPLPGQWDECLKALGSSRFPPHLGASEHFAHDCVCNMELKSQLNMQGNAPTHLLLRIRWVDWMSSSHVCLLNVKKHPSGLLSVAQRGRQLVRRRLNLSPSSEKRIQTKI